MRYLAQSVAMDSPLLFINYVLWLKVLLMQYKITAEDLRINFTLMKDAISASLDPPARELILSYLDMAIFHMKGEESPPSFLRPEKPYFREADEYLRLLLEGERRKASACIIRLYDEGFRLRIFTCISFRKPNTN